MAREILAQSRWNATPAAGERRSFLCHPEVLEGSGEVGGLRRLRQLRFGGLKNPAPDSSSGDLCRNDRRDARRSALSAVNVSPVAVTSPA